jgi:hypothetical protein
VERVRTEQAEEMKKQWEHRFRVAWKSFQKKHSSLERFREL